MLENKNILIGITGGIAAYKICTLIRLFKKSGANVRVVMTPNAENFVTKLTLQSLSGNEVYINHFEIDEYKPEHIALTNSDIFVIAPASANTISKIANGICDNLLSSTACAFRGPILIAPAMNDGMWNNPIIQDNINKLKEYGYHILEPAEGYLACGTSGVGRMRESEEIFEKTVEIITPQKNEKKILITAGGTIEKIDPVRYITNASSGKMGIALADEAYKKGFDVTLITTFPLEKNYKTIVAQSAAEMQTAVKNNFPEADCLIMSAAVSDFRVANYSDQKIKKTASVNYTLELVKNPDILKEISEEKRENQVVIGFCAESENLLENAKIKIQEKGCDYLVANDISRKDIGFNSDNNEVYIINKNLDIKHLEIASKQNIAKQILEEIFE